MARTSAPHRHRLRAPVIGTAALLLILPTVAVADDGSARDIDQACLGSSSTEQRFTDVTGGVHEPAINCIAAFYITVGSGAGDYDGSSPVTREQMATFLTRSLARMRPSVFTLPEIDHTDDGPFGDEVSGVHGTSVNQLYELGIVAGQADGTYGATANVNRQQLATFVVRTIEEVTGEDLPQSASFADVSGTHQDNVEKLATIGVLQGTGPDTFEPHADVTRAQMATILARALDYLVEEGAMYGVDGYPRTPPDARFGLTDVGVTEQDDTDQVTLQVEGDDGHVGWSVRYVEEAVQDGSGNPVDVEGDAILLVELIGSVPAGLGGLPPEIEDELFDFDEEAIEAEGDAIVDVVNGGIFEARHRIFIGTTGTLPFTVEREADPQVVTVEIEHPTDD